MKINIFLCTLFFSLLFFNCSIYKSQNCQENYKSENEMNDNYDDTMTIVFLTYCLEKQNFCMDSLRCFFTANTEDGLWRFSDQPENFSFSKKHDTLNILPINIRFGKNVVVDQFFNLFNILVNIRNNVYNKDYSINYFDSLAIKTSSFFDLDNKTPVILLDTMKYEYSYYEGEKILKDSTSLFVELKIDRLEECNLNYLKIRHDTIRQNDFVVHRYKSINDFCEEFDFTLSFKTNEKNIMDSSSIFDFDEWILEYFKFPQEKLNKD